MTKPTGTTLDGLSNAHQSSSFSIVTPSFNQAAFLPRCIASVGDQIGDRVGPVEHLVLDPGSDDDSRQIAAASASVTAVFEDDDGQADAVRRGMKRANGQIVGWLNADDVYADNQVFQRVATRFAAADRPDIVYGRGQYIDANGTVLDDVAVTEHPDELADSLMRRVGIFQPAVFLRRSVVDILDGPDPALAYAMDYDLWIRASQAGLRFGFEPAVLARAVVHDDAKSSADREAQIEEAIDVVGRRFGFVSEPWARLLATHRVTGADGRFSSASGVDPSGNDQLGSIDRDRIDDETRRILRAHNWSWSARVAIASRPWERPRLATGVKMARARAVDPPVAVPAGIVRKVPGARLRVVDGRRWAFRRSWVGAELRRSAALLEARKADRSRDRCVLVGNGPSLLDSPLDLLGDEDVIITNYAFRNPLLRAAATYLCVVNNLVAEQAAGRIGLIEDLTVVMPWWLTYAIRPSANHALLPSQGTAEFSTDILVNASWRHTVSFFAFQLAYWLGYREVIMIGFDHSYRQAIGLDEGETVEQEGPDLNHFDPAYFRSKRWHAADVDRMEDMYRLAKEAFEADGRRIVNATSGGHLELFERIDLPTALTRPL